ncbi:hypothetical protein [Chryseobacterium wanjuense]
MNINDLNELKKGNPNNALLKNWALVFIKNTVKQLIILLRLNILSLT